MMIGKELLLIGMLMGVTHDEVTCLADNMYFEARNQSLAGMLDVSKVVHEGPTRPSWKDKTKQIPVRNKCQFSWYCDGKSDEPSDIETYDAIYGMAEDMLYQNMPYLDITDGATHYHADYITPSWAYTKTRTVEIEDHIFYRWEYDDVK